MKIKLSVQEIIAMLDGEVASTDEIKETMTGALVALIGSDQMKATMSRVTVDHVRSMLKDALSVKPRWGSEPKTLEGWAADIMKQHLIDELKDVNIKAVIQEQLASVVEQMVLAQFDAVQRKSVTEEVTTYLAGRDLLALIRGEVKHLFKQLQL